MAGVLGYSSDCQCERENATSRQVTVTAFCKYLYLQSATKIVETLYLNRVTSENKRIRTPPLSPPFKVGVFVVFYR